MGTTRTLRLSTALATVLALSAGACSDDGTAAESDAPVEVTLQDFAFVGVPDEVAAGSRLTVRNVSESELHEIVAFRLADDEARDVAELATLPPAELEQILGPPVTVLLAEPDGPVVPAVGDGTLTEPGRYALLCFIPTGVEPEVYLRAAAESEGGPPEVEGGPPHLVHGMHAEITVRP